MLIITNIHDFHYFIVFRYHIIKSNISFFHYISNIIYPANYISTASIGYTLFELNCGYHLRMLYKNNVNFRFKLKLVEKLSAELRKLMIIY